MLRELLNPMLRRRGVRTVAALMLLGMTIGLCTLEALSCASRTKDQGIQAQYGSADGITNADTIRIPLGTKIPELQVAPSANQAETILTVIDTFLVDGSPRQLVTYVESPPTGLMTPQHFSLASGRWPQKPGEVLIGTSLGTTSSTVGVGAGKWDLTIVGTVSSRSSSSATDIVAFPGTWETAVLTPEQSDELHLEAQIQIAWTSSDPELTAREMSAIYKDPRSRLPPEKTAKEVQQKPDQLTSRQVLVLYAPFTFIASGCCLIAIGRTRRQDKDLIRILIDNGVSESPLRAASAIAAALSTLCAAASADLISLALRSPVRAAMASVWGHPAGRYAPRLVYLLLPPVAATAVFIGTVWRAHPRRLRPAPTPVADTTSHERLPVWIAAALLLLTLPVARLWGAKLLVLVMCFALSAIASALLAGAALKVIAATASPFPGRALAAIRFLRSGLSVHARSATACVLLAGFSAITMGYIGSGISYTNRASGTGIPHGLVVFVEKSDAIALSPERYLEFAKDTGLSNPVPVWIEMNRDNRSWNFSSINDVEKTLGPLSSQAKEKLASTGSASAGASSTVAIPLDFTMRNVTRIKVTTTPPANDGMKTWVFSHVDHDKEITAADWPAKHGLQDRVVMTASLLPPLPIPMSVQLSCAALGVVAALFLARSLRAEERQLVPLYRGMEATGISHRWINHIKMLTAAIIAVVASLLALLGFVWSALLSRIASQRSLRIVDQTLIGVVLCLSAPVIGALVANLLTFLRRPDSNGLTRE